METFPKITPDAKTGSSAGTEPLLAERSKILAARNSIFEKPARTFQRENKKKFTKAGRRAADQIIEQVKKEWRVESLALGSDPTKVKALRLQTQKKLNRLLARELPGFRAWQVARSAYLREHRKLSKLALADVALRDQLHVQWGEIKPPVAPDTQEFTAPYADYDVRTLDIDHLVSNDTSFVRPAIGHFVNNIIVRHRNDAWPFDYNPTLFVDNAASCGTFFTMPRPGRIQVTGSLRNFYSKVMFSTEDNFGFSSSELNIQLNLFVAILRESGVVYLQKNLANDGLGSHGVDLAYTMGNLDDTTPYTVQGTTPDPLPAGEAVRILVGSEVYIQSYVDDMENDVNAVLWWQLQKMTVAIV